MREVNDSAGIIQVRAFRKRFYNLYCLAFCASLCYILFVLKSAFFLQKVR